MYLRNLTIPDIYILYLLMYMLFYTVSPNVYYFIKKNHKSSNVIKVYLISVLTEYCFKIHCSLNLYLLFP